MTNIHENDDSKFTTVEVFIAGIIAGLMFSSLFWRLIDILPSWLSFPILVLLPTLWLLYRGPLLYYL